MPVTLPANEIARLEALKSYGILDTPPEPVYDGFTVLAARICQAPVAFLTLIDKNRQWFKSKVGSEICETARDVAFCAHTLEDKSLVEVTDTLLDGRFSSNPFVVGPPHIRFYAGAPLITPQGFNLGTLCVVDVISRTLTPEQRESLTLFSQLIMTQLELKLAHQRAAQQSAALDRLVAQRTRDLSESEERFRQLAAHSSEGFWFASLNPDQILYVNPAIERILGVSSSVLFQNPRAWRDAVHPEDRTAVYAAMDAVNEGREPTMDIEFRILRPDGTTRWVRDSATPIRDETGRIIRVGGIIQDITEIKQADAHRLRTQRLESIGTLAGGIAHDLNNALSPIMIGVAMLRTRSAITNQEILDTIESSARYGAGMVRQLLTFAKGVVGEPVLLQPVRLLRDMQTLIEGTFPKNIELRTRLNRNLRPILADPTQMHQVLLNLCVNARDAMPQGGLLTLEAQNREILPTELPLFPEAKPGKYVVWQVGDTGGGIPPDVLERIYEPFFSTKTPDKGTGLGLSTVLGIVKSHQGFMRVESEIGIGSKFFVFLPVAEDVSQDRHSPAPASPPGSNDRILVVDDDLRTREMLTLFLHSHGFHVATAKDGVDALKAVNESPQPFDAIITDLHMPRASGLDFIRTFRLQDTTTGILVCSGRVDDQDATELKAVGHCEILHKPFTRESLFSRLSTILVSGRARRTKSTEQGSSESSVPTPPVSP